MLGAGGAPRGRGLRAHQKPFRIYDQFRTLTHLPKTKKTKEKNKRRSNQNGKKRQEDHPRARPGTRQANPTGRRQGKRPKEQLSSHQNRLANIVSSSRQNRPGNRENFSQGHQNRLAIDRQPPSTTVTAHAGIEEYNRQNARRTTTASEDSEKSQTKPKRQNMILHLPTSKGAHLPTQSKWQRARKAKRAMEADKTHI